ncbi:hypothetical protein K469DRAFT_42249 [Zopfia rhizophila CBS 207.26]|uniref:HTH La-type RNA-binding domain-containing protein n=1 Tax=Zopfia rhizophila CBS 207.26 TaxID=1314779 RepID=A0A6A6EEQ1_9PEZI|nr:hypothetical protein K469DRAFT_42249 [Zopfia rhizophila CBS 207.26]
MATTPRGSGSDVAATPVPFSYAQAAKGMSSSGTSPVAASKPHSGTITPSKEVNPAPATVPAASGMSWADDAEANETHAEKQTGAREGQVNGVPTSSKQANVQQQTTVSSISSPDLGASSSSTVTKDDDVSSIQNTSSESTWENKSQASTSVDRSTEPSERTADKVKEKGLDRSTFQPLQEAPLPAVNIWKQRADDAKAKAALRSSSAKPATAVSTPAVPNGLPQGPSGKKKSKMDEGDGKGEALTNEVKAKARDEERTSQLRKETRQEADAEKNKKGAKGRPLEKDNKTTTTVLPLPPVRDQESWPTPDSAADERRKAQEKGEKNEKERSQTTTSRPHGKQGWVNVPITPNVIFNTPLPSTAPARRGGRGGGRGGAQSGGRGNAYGTNGSGNAEKDASTPSALPSSDQPRRGRSDGPAARESSPAKGKRTVSDGSTSLKETKPPAVPGNQSSKTTPAPEPETTSRRSSVMTESTPASQISGQSNTFPRQYPSSRPIKGRRGELPGQGDRRKDSDLVSPTKENAASFDGRTSTATQTDGKLAKAKNRRRIGLKGAKSLTITLAPEDGDRRASTVQDGHTAQTKQGPNDRRPFGSFSARERGRGALRGGRAGYQNGHHQFANGHVPSLQSSSTFPLPRSPTSFHPEQNAYFSAPPSNGRNYRGNASRSQSLTTDNMYGRVPTGYPGGPQPIPPIQTYMGGVYDYPMMQPMSAIPFSPFGADQVTLFGMVSMQLEYYFSVENLCKDIFLRKHMDSKGFVFLSVIAEFNRIKQLTADIELIKYACSQSPSIEHIVGADGKDRLRRRDGWEQWVLGMSERHSSAQNDGPKELHNPPVPHPNGFEHSMPRYPEVSAGSPISPVPLAGDLPYQSLNGIHPGSPENLSTSPTESTANGQAADTSNGPTATHGQPNGEADSFSDEQVESLTVIVRKQDQAQPATVPPAATRTFSNGSIDSRSGVPDDTEKMNARLSGLKVNGTGPSQG